MDIKELFNPGAEVIEKMDLLSKELETGNDVESSEIADRSADCTGCWGGTCAHGITG